MSRSLNKLIPAFLVLLAIAVCGAGLVATRMHGRRIGRTVARPDPRPVDDHGVAAATAVHVPAADAETGPTAPREMLGSRVDLVGSLRTLKSAPAGSRARHLAAGNLIRLLRRSPEHAEHVARCILDAGGGAEEASRLLHCLATAGTRDCQLAILRVLVSSGEDAGLRSQALYALAILREPVDAIRGLLARMASEHGEDAARAFEVWSVLAGRSPGGATRWDAAAHARDRLATARRPAGLRFALDALGHVGTRDLPEQVLDATRAPEPDVRAAAMRAMRRVQSPAADLALLRCAREDPVAGVRWGALEVLGHRLRDRAPGARARGGGDLVRAVRTIAEADSSPRVRRRAAELLAQWRRVGS